jgi:hypothetical protein
VAARQAHKDAHRSHGPWLQFLRDWQGERGALRQRNQELTPVVQGANQLATVGAERERDLTQRKETERNNSGTTTTQQLKENAPR